MPARHSTRWYFLRWLRGFAYAADGIIIIVTFGFLESPFGLWTEHAFLTESEIR